MTGRSGVRTITRRVTLLDLDGSQPEASRFFADVYFGDHKDADVADYR